MTDLIQIKDTDFGFWFGIDGVAIKNQPQLDLAVIQLASVYGFTIDQPACVMETLYAAVSQIEDESELPHDPTHFLIWQAESAIQYLNAHLPAGAKFDFSGEEYDQLHLVKL